MWWNRDGLHYLGPSKTTPQSTTTKTEAKCLVRHSIFALKKAHRFMFSDPSLSLSLSVSVCLSVSKASQTLPLKQFQ